MEYGVEIEGTSTLRIILCCAAFTKATGAIPSSPRHNPKVFQKNIPRQPLTTPPPID